MNLIFKCNVSLSKKIRKICASDVSLLVSEIEDGKGVGTLIIKSDSDIEEAKNLLENETSIMLTPLEVDLEAPSYDAVPNLFSDQASYMEDLNPNDKNELRSFVETQPSKKEERIGHFGKKNEIPEQFEELNDPQIKNHINDVQELWAEIERTKNEKTSDIDPDSIEDERKRLEAIETINVEEGLEKHAYVVNDTSGSIILSDIGLTFDKNIPQDLSKISAKTLYRSNDLRVLLREKLLKLIPPEERDFYLQKQKKDQIQFGLDTYDNIDDAMDDIGKNPRQKEREVGEYDEINLEVDDDYQTENQILASQIPSSPQTQSKTLSGGVRKRSYGNKKTSQQISNQNVPKSSQTNFSSQDEIKNIAKKTIGKKF